MAEENNGTPPEPPRLPKLISSRPGRIVSLGGLVERIIEQYQLEQGDDASVPEAVDETARRMRLRAVAEYVFAVESVQLALAEQAEIIQRAYSEMFGYGPLDALLHDPAVTTITLEGTEKVAVRHQPGTDFAPLEPFFDDGHHLRQTVRRLLAAAGAELREDTPIIETGLTVAGRRLCLNVAGPPFTAELSVDMRLHPAAPLLLDDLVAAGYLPSAAAGLLRALAESPHGLVIVGDTESGKTTLLGALAHLLPPEARIVAVERAGELALPAGVERFMVRWPLGENPGNPLTEQVAAALAVQPGCLLLDEVRSDEPQAIAPLLADNAAPRLLWTFRGTADTRRTRSALGMVARMTDPAQPEARVRQLYQRLPFMLVVKRRRGHIALREIGEWQWGRGTEYPDYVELFAPDAMGQVNPTGKRPLLPLALPDAFWSPPA